MVSRKMREIECVKLRRGTGEGGRWKRRRTVEAKEERRRTVEEKEGGGREGV